MNTVRISYMISSRTDASNAEVVELAEVVARVTELSGRTGLLTIPSIQRQLRERGRTYIACNRGTEGAKTYGQGFILSRVTEAVR